MVINCYNTGDDANKVDKALTLVKTITADIKSGANILTPRLIITNPASVNFNYVQIVDAPYNGRYYFVKPENTAFNGIVDIELHEDVLMSLKGQIRGLTGIIARQENEGNLYMEDSSFPVENRNELFYKEFPNGFSQTYNYYLITGV